ncbi:hypothetical protein EMPS_07687 [Entomortierella parvispora]|uniref:Uncharacterized protein n=1 Tax=Entomortierella parvispora TaxID=205924 RepID=A0A9P3HER6_9FUNG|nr:hypothetical protein EMPS_07687 [Entomortierella parvispora]
MNTTRPPSRNTAGSPASPSAGPQQYRPQTPPRRPAKVAQTAQIDLNFAAFPATKPPTTASLGVSRSQHLQQQQQQQQRHQLHPQNPLPLSRPTIKMASKSRSSNPVSASGSVRSVSSRMTQGNGHPQPQHRQQQQQQQGQREGVTRGVSNSLATGDGEVSRRSGGGTGVGIIVKPSASAGALLAAASASTTGARGEGVTVKLANAQGHGHGHIRDGSVTSSDDGAVSEGSVEDHIQLFSGGGGIHLNSLPFGVPSREGLVTTRRATTSESQIVSQSVPISRRDAAAGGGEGARGGGSSSTRSLTSTRMVRAAPSSPANPSSSTTRRETKGDRPAGGTKSIKIATGASIKLDGIINSHPSNSISIPASSALGLSSSTSAFGSNLLSSSFSSSTSSSSLSWISGGSSSKRHSIVARSAQDDSGPTSPTTPSTPTFNHINHINSLQIPTLSFTNTTSTATTTTTPSQPPTSSQAKVSKPTASLPNESGASIVAAASRLAEENRRSGEAARTRRKIADLEISNASLLQVNQSLEATIRKQAAEIQELRMRIQSAPFELGFDQSQDTDSQDGLVPFSDTYLERPYSQDAKEGEITTAQRIQEMRTESERQADLIFKRLCLSIEHMLFEARQALDQSTKPGVKVLSSFDVFEKEAEYNDNDEGDDNEDESGDLDEDLAVGNQLLDLGSRHSPEGDDENDEIPVHRGLSVSTNHENYTTGHARVRVADLDKVQVDGSIRKQDSAIEILDLEFLGHRPP